MFVQENCAVCGRRGDFANPWKLCPECHAASEAEIKEYNEKLGALYETDRRGYKAMMADKNMYLLFEVDSAGGREYETETRRITINTESGIPYVQMMRCGGTDIRPGSSSAGIPSVISYPMVHYWARVKSEETYGQYKGISKENWIDYV